MGISATIRIRNLSRALALDMEPNPWFSLKTFINKYSLCPFAFSGDISGRSLICLYKGEG